MKFDRNALIAAMGVAGMLGAGSASASVGDLFQVDEVTPDHWTAVAEAKEGTEHKCGEGSCGGEAAKSTENSAEKSAEHKCGEGSCGGEKAAEHKCGEGSCGGEEATADTAADDGKGKKMSRKEKKAAKKAAKDKGAEAKCGEGKCG